MAPAGDGGGLRLCSALAEVRGNGAGLRQAVRHLRGGGALFLFTGLAHGVLALFVAARRRTQEAPPESDQTEFSDALASALTSSVPASALTVARFTRSAYKGPVSQS